MFNHIKKIGIEVEGGWNALPAGCGRDGSVNVLGYQSGEMVSRPMSDFNQAVSWMESIYPNATNRTCGLHVHFSFHSLTDYARLMDKAFQDYFLKRMQQWGVENKIVNKNFWLRLDGKNQYCKRTWAADVQVKQFGKSTYRYAQWNFCHMLHGTAECRVLPTFKSSSVAKKAVAAVVQIVEDYLDGGIAEVGFKLSVSDE